MIYFNCDFGCFGTFFTELRPLELIQLLALYWKLVLTEWFWICCLRLSYYMVVIGWAAEKEKMSLSEGERNRKKERREMEKDRGRESGWDKGRQNERKRELEGACCSCNWWRWQNKVSYLDSSEIDLRVSVNSNLVVIHALCHFLLLIQIWKCLKF